MCALWGELQWAAGMMAGWRRCVKRVLRGEVEAGDCGRVLRGDRVILHGLARDDEAREET